MKTVGNFATLAGLSLMLFALGATRAKAQALDSTQFAGTFTLPLEAQWGTMTLPAGNYSLYYGQLNRAVGPFVEVVGKAKGSPTGWILAGPADRTSATRNALICVRDGDSLVVRKLQLPAIGASVSFAMPRGRKLLAHNQKHGKYTLAEAPMLIQRVAVELNGK
jgi:hypothetical protein